MMIPDIQIIDAFIDIGTVYPEALMLHHGRKWLRPLPFTCSPSLYQRSKCTSTKFSFYGILA